MNLKVKLLKGFAIIYPTFDNLGDGGVGKGTSVTIIDMIKSTSFNGISGLCIFKDNNGTSRKIWVDIGFLFKLK